MATVQTRIEQPRGCGYRKKGGMYLMSEGMGEYCYKLPVPLVCCSFCGSGFKPIRGFQWIMSDLFQKLECKQDGIFGSCDTCPLSKSGLKMGLIWIGEKYYKTAQDFAREANMMGVSRRISQIPKELKIGETWLCVAHRKTIYGVNEKGEMDLTPGIFHAFKPTRMEYVVKGTESEDELNRLEERGFTLVNVVRDVDAQKKLYE